LVHYLYHFSLEPYNVARYNMMTTAHMMLVVGAAIVYAV
jgi:hypothetical protein